jgi:hypothetical protein
MRIEDFIACCADEMKTRRASIASSSRLAVALPAGSGTADHFV